jgi:hypothetical protein
MQGLLAKYEVIHWCLFPGVILKDIWLKMDVLAGGVEYSTKGISMSPALSVLKVPLEVPKD